MARMSIEKTTAFAEAQVAAAAMAGRSNAAIANRALTPIKNLRAYSGRMLSGMNEARTLFVPICEVASLC
jgi:hypothetical protein